MHVAHVSCFVDRLGRSPEALLDAWPTLSDVARAVADAGVRVSVVQAAGTDARLERLGIPVHFVSVPQRQGVRRFLRTGMDRLAEHVRDIGPDLIHFHGVRFPVELLSVQSRVGGIPILVQDHKNGPPRWGLRWLSRRGFDNVAAVLFTAREQALPFVKCGVFSEDLPVFEVMESSSSFSPGDQTDARVKTGLSGDPCLLWIGRLNATKDPITVLEGVRRAIRHLPSLALWCFYTDAPLLTQVQSLVAGDVELARRVHLMGTVPHERVELLCRAADFLLLGSHREGTTFSVLEALACGATPIITGIPPFERITGGGRVGALWPTGDAAALARAIVELAQRDRRELRQAARAHFETFLSFTALGQRLREVYESVESSTHRGSAVP